MKKIAVLDDYQNVALESADLTPLNGRAEITVFNNHTRLRVANGSGALN